ncbi:manganese efflux pump MntP family protein [Desulfovibrionales bacterium]
MPFIEILLIALALAMDAFAVAIAIGAMLKIVTHRQTLRLAWHFGLFQAVMPLVGWWAGVLVRDALIRFGHWIAFLLLLYIGGHMLWAGFSPDKDGTCCQDPTTGSRLVMLSVATSIDALAVGLSLALVGTSIWYPACIIGLVAFGCTALGLRLGSILGCHTRLGHYAERLGGAVLVGIGVKIVFQAW